MLTDVTQCRQSGIQLAGGVGGLLHAGGSPDKTGREYKFSRDDTVTDDFKILCVGFQKTGTTSLTSALMRLGFSVGNAHEPILQNLTWTDTLTQDIQKIALEQAHRYDAVQDSPYPFLYEELDREFPNSKFILTVRPTESWVRSMRSFFPNKMNLLRRWMAPSWSRLRMPKGWRGWSGCRRRCRVRVTPK